jgi:plasmid stability protein
MPTLYVENVPQELYDALKERAKRERRSLAAEVVRILEQNVPTAADLARREAVFREIDRVRASSSLAPGPSTDEMIREDRDR